MRYKIKTRFKRLKGEETVTKNDGFTLERPPSPNGGVDGSDRVKCPQCGERQDALQGHHNMAQ